jgi:hypothetical protein
MVIMVNELKFCKDCKHSGMSLFDKIMSFGEESFLKCTNPALVEADLVDGKMRPHFCSAMRIFGCGKEGKFFEKKEAK